MRNELRHSAVLAVSVKAVLGPQSARCFCYNTDMFYDIVFPLSPLIKVFTPLHKLNLIIKESYSICFGLGTNTAVLIFMSPKRGELQNIFHIRGGRGDTKTALHWKIAYCIINLLFVDRV